MNQDAEIRLLDRELREAKEKLGQLLAAVDSLQEAKIKTQRLLVAAGPRGKIVLTLIDAGGETWYFRFRPVQIGLLEDVLRRWAACPELGLGRPNAQLLLNGARAAIAALIGLPPIAIPGGPVIK